MKISGPIPVYHAANLKSPAVEFAGIEAEIKQAKKQAEHQKKMKAAQAELQRYPEYQELMMSDVELAYGKKIKGYQFLQLIQEKQNRQIYGLLPNAKRLLVGALSATVLGGMGYWMINGAQNSRSPDESAMDMAYSFTNRLSTKAFYKAIETDRVSGNLRRIMNSSLVTYYCGEDYFKLSPLGKTVLRNFLEQERLGLLKPSSEKIEKRLPDSEMESQSSQLIQMLQPVFPQQIESASIFDMLKTMASLDKKLSWVQKKLGQGVPRRQILKSLNKAQSLKPEEDLAFSKALSFLMEGRYILANNALSRFTVTPDGLSVSHGMLQHDSPVVFSRSLYISVLKKFIQDLKVDKESNKQQVTQLDEAFQQTRRETEKTAQSLEQKLQACKALKAKGQSVQPELKSKYLMEVDQAVDAYREAEVKHQVMMERLAEHQKIHDEKRITLGKNLQYLDQLLVQLQEKQWLTETPSGRFVPEEAFGYLQLLGKQLHAFQNGLATDLISNPTEQEVDRILTELSVEEKLNQVLASAPETSEP
jgi:hypothetical protein